MPLRGEAHVAALVPCLGGGWAQMKSAHLILQIREGEWEPGPHSWKSWSAWFCTTQRAKQHSPWPLSVCLSLSLSMSLSMSLSLSLCLSLCLSLFSIPCPFWTLFSHLRHLSRCHSTTVSPVLWICRPLLCRRLLSSLQSTDFSRPLKSSLSPHPSCVSYVSPVFSCKAFGNFPSATTSDPMSTTERAS